MEIEPRVKTNSVNSSKQAVSKIRQAKQSLRLQVVEIEKSSQQRLELITHDIENKQVNAISNENSLDEKHTIKVLVEGLWARSHIVKTTIIHLVNPIYNAEDETYAVDNSTGLLVVEPDTLLTCTLVASSLFCERKTWLNQVFLGDVGTNRAMLVGTLVHEVFQYGVKNKIVDTQKLTKFLDEQLDDATVMLEIFSVEKKLSEIRDEAITYISSVREWIQNYMLAGPNHPLTNDSELEVKIIGVSDIEENVWSTKYGLKGKIDVTGSVRVYDKRTRTSKVKTLPLELKTGNPNLSASHAAQVSLYSMMIEDRYAETNQGLVIYLKDKAAMHNVALTHNVKRDLVQRRNELNYHLKGHYSGPEFADVLRICRNCERLTECILMSEIYDGDIDRYSTMMSLRRHAIGHLDPKFIEFFKRYHEKLVALMTNSNHTKSEANGDSPAKPTATESFWNYSSQDAETQGSGIGKLQAVAPSKENTQSEFITFKRHPEHPQNLTINSPEKNSKSNDDVSPKQTVKKQKIEDYFKPKKLATGNLPRTKPFKPDQVNLSRCRLAISEDGKSADLDSQNSSTAIAIGYLHELKEDQIVVKIFDGAKDTIKADVMYRIDRIEKKSNYDIERLVLVKLLAPENFRVDRIRQLILDSSFKPSFNPDMDLFDEDGFEELAELDESLKEVVQNVVSTSNYYVLNESEVSAAELNLVLSVLIRVILSFDRTVLIAATSVDDLVDLMRLLQKKGKRFILIDDGKSTKARFQFASNLVKVPQGESLPLEKKFDSYIRQHESAPVVFTSFAMSIGGLLFTRRIFDYSIALGCDKTELLTSLAPMFCSDRHIIIDVRESEQQADNATINSQTKDFTDNISLGNHLRCLRPIEA